MPVTLGPRPARTLLIGCGALGIHLGNRLVSEGGRVFAVRRDLSELPSTFHTAAIDLTTSPLGPLPEADAMVITLPPNAAGAHAEPGYSTALHHLADALPNIPARVIFVSSTRVFEGRPGPVPLTEDDAPSVISARGRALIDGERQAMDLFGAHVIRPAGIYGPGREMLIRKVRNGDPVSYAQRTNRIHEADLVDALDVMLRAEKAPRLVHAVDQSPAALGEVVTFIAEQLGVEAPPRITPESSTGTVLDGARLHTMVGALRYPTFREGYAEMIARDRSASGY